MKNLIILKELFKIIYLSEIVLISINIQDNRIK